VWGSLRQGPQRTLTSYSAPMPGALLTPSLRSSFEMTEEEWLRPSLGMTR
jgi:hypothetical protein